VLLIAVDRKQAFLPLWLFFGSAIFGRRI